MNTYLDQQEAMIVAQSLAAAHDLVETAIRNGAAERTAEVERLQEDRAAIIARILFNQDIGALCEAKA